MHWAVEVMLGPAVGDEGAVHLRGGHVQFVLLKQRRTRALNDYHFLLGEYRRWRRYEGDF